MEKTFFVISTFALLQIVFFYYIYLHIERGLNII